VKASRKDILKWTLFKKEHTISIRKEVDVEHQKIEQEEARKELH